MVEAPNKRAGYRAESAGAQRELRAAKPVEADLGPLALLPGVWSNLRDPDHPDDPARNPLAGRGWNLIALPFAKAEERRPYRLLMNQYNEQLVFSTVDDKVPNRGITADRPPQRADQLVATLDYQQTIRQIAASDVSASGDAGPAGLPIHHEPGLFLHMKQQRIDGFDIARLATIPHGNAANAIGRSEIIDGPPDIPDLSGFPEGVTDDIATAVAEAADPLGYLFPYHVFAGTPFRGVIPESVTEFPGFGPANANALLQGFIEETKNPAAPERPILRTTVLDLGTDAAEAGIVNIPFIERQADAAEMRSVFWIMEQDAEGPLGGPRLLLVYSQFIYLDFFDRFDGKPGLIRWPHVSINVMEKVANPPEDPSGYGARIGG